ncbi:MAG: hypothetical protein IPM48_03130 [Saprospiraceae bacterium]|nr:hypothetical protein [Saprospiraceae bacterium]
MKFQPILGILLLSLFFIQCKQDKSGGSAATGNKESTQAEDHKMTKGQVEEERSQLLGWLKNRSDLVHFNQLMNQSSTIIPLLYEDKRLKVNYFVPTDVAFKAIGGELAGKLNDNMPDDAELKLLNQLIVKTTDFSWAGATSLGGVSVKFGEAGATVVIGSTEAKVLETVMLSARSRAYIIDRCPR